MVETVVNIGKNCGNLNVPALDKSELETMQETTQLERTQTNDSDEKMLSNAQENTKKLEN